MSEIVEASLFVSSINSFLPQKFSEKSHLEDNPQVMGTTKNPCIYIDRSIQRWHDTKKTWKFQPFTSQPAWNRNRHCGCHIFSVVFFPRLPQQPLPLVYSSLETKWTPGSRTNLHTQNGWQRVNDISTWKWIFCQLMGFWITPPKEKNITQMFKNRCSTWRIEVIYCQVVSNELCHVHFSSMDKSVEVVRGKCFNLKAFFLGYLSRCWTWPENE